MSYTKQTPETEARDAARHEASISARLADRDVLTRQLARWCYLHAPEIEVAMIEWRRTHEGQEPNAIMVPSQFTLVAWGAKFDGKFLVTSIYNDDVPVTMPTPLRILVPESLNQRACDLLDEAGT